MDVLAIPWAIIRAVSNMVPIVKFVVLSNYDVPKNKILIASCRPVQ